MVDFSVFDSILDSAFVVDGRGMILYCNDAAAAFCQTSIRRLINKSTLSDLFTVGQSGILPFDENSQGRHAPTSFIETDFKLTKGDRAGKIQLAIRPIDSAHWLVTVRDVSLEEALYTKFRSELAQKEDYARNLEKLVEARTAELRKVNQTLNAILNSLGQGFFTFDVNGKCGDIYTKACESILEGIPKGREVTTVLGIPSGEVDNFQKWMESTFKELLPFDDLKVLGPSLYPHSKGRHVVLDFFPIRREDETITDLVVVATDKTAEYQAQMDLEVERQFASMVIRYTKNKNQFVQFLASIRESLAKLKEMAASPLLRTELAECFRILHTIEGEAGAFSLRELRMDARTVQQVIEPYKNSQTISSEIQKSFSDALDKMSTRYEDFLNLNQDLFQIPRGEVSRSVELAYDDLEAFYKALERSNTDKALREHFRQTFFKVPIETRLRYFDGLVQSVAQRLGKAVKPLVIEGGDTRIFPEAYHNVCSSMVHAFRNAIDHGIEMPDEREFTGKNLAGEIKISVRLENGYMNITIKDDGKGIDPQVIREKLKEKFPDRDFSQQNDDEIIQNVCLPGFSSRDSIGEFSGRGVGLDALREEVLKVGGKMQIKSVIGQGTVIEIQIPDCDSEMPVLRSA